MRLAQGGRFATGAHVGASEMAEEFCPDLQLTPYERAKRASDRLGAAKRGIGRDSPQSAKDNASRVALAEGEAILHLLPQLPKWDASPDNKNHFIVLQLDYAAEFLFGVDRCAEGKRLYDAASRERRKDPQGDGKPMVIYTGNCLEK